MKYLLIAALLFPTISLTQEYSREEHEQMIEIKSVGHDHVNHQVLINKSVLVEQLANEMWFIEEVACTEKGFKFKASHIQYSDSTKKEFLLNIGTNNQYELQ